MEKLDLENILARISSELDDCVAFWTKFSHDEDAGLVVYFVILLHLFSVPEVSSTVCPVRGLCMTRPSTAGCRVARSGCTAGSTSSWRGSG